MGERQSRRERTPFGSFQRAQCFDMVSLRGEKEAYAWERGEGTHTELKSRSVLIKFEETKQA